MVLGSLVAVVKCGVFGVFDVAAAVVAVAVVVSVADVFFCVVAAVALPFSDVLGLTCS